jgi:hypothetical protein
MADPLPASSQEVELVVDVTGQQQPFRFLDHQLGNGASERLVIVDGATVIFQGFNRKPFGCHGSLPRVFARTLVRISGRTDKAITMPRRVALTVVDSGQFRD